MKTSFMSFIFLFICTGLFAQFPNCKYLEEGQKPAKASIEEVNWITGHYQGEAFGGFIEEKWTDARAGAMMGSFRMLKEDQVKFYELMTISEEDESLVLRIKHFDKDLKGWEEKEESMETKLVEIKHQKAFFEGITFERTPNDQLYIYVIMDHEGKKQESIFTYHRIAD